MSSSSKGPWVSKMWKKENRRNNETKPVQLICRLFGKKWTHCTLRIIILRSKELKWLDNFSWASQVEIGKGTIKALKFESTMILYFFQVFSYPLSFSSNITPPVLHVSASKLNAKDRSYDAIDPTMSNIEPDFSGVIPLSSQQFELFALKRCSPVPSNKLFLGILTIDDDANCRIDPCYNFCLCFLDNK